MLVISVPFHLKHGEVRRELFYAPVSASLHPSAPADSLVPYNPQTKEEPVVLSKVGLSLFTASTSPPEGH